MRMPWLKRIEWTRIIAWAVYLSAWLAPLAAEAQTSFFDITTSAGIDYQQHAPQMPGSCIFSNPQCEPDRMTGGAAVADVNGDGTLDLFVTRLDQHDLLFLNQGNGTFVDGTIAAGLDGFDLQSNGAVFGDVDNDGDPDLYVTVMGAQGDSVNDRGFLFVNDGSGVFSEEAVVRGAAVENVSPHRVFTPTFGDYDRDGWLDLHMVEWLQGPGSNNARLLHNRGAAMPGHFEDKTASAGVHERGRSSITSLWQLRGSGDSSRPRPTRPKSGPKSLVGRRRRRGH